MRNATWDQRTVIQTRTPGIDYAPPPETLDGVSLSLDSGMRVTIDGESWRVFGPRSVAIDTGSRTVVTTITVVKDS